MRIILEQNKTEFFWFLNVFDSQLLQAFNLYSVGYLTSTCSMTNIALIKLIQIEGIMYSCFAKKKI